jgi:starch synthase
MIAVTENGKRAGHTYRVENGRILHEDESILDGEEQPQGAASAFGVNIAGFLHRLSSSVKEFLAQLGEFLSRPLLATAEKLMTNGTLARKKDDAISPLLRQALETAVADRRSELGIKETDDVRFNFLTFARSVNDGPSQRLFASLGIETEKKLLNTVHTIIFTEHPILRRQLFTSLQNNSSPKGFTSLEQFMKLLAEYEVEEYLALHRPYSKTGAAFTAYIMQERSLSSGEAFLSEHRPAEQFNAFIEYLAQRQPLHPLAAQTALLRLGDELNERWRLMEDAFVNYPALPQAVRVESNYAFRHLEQALLTNNFTLFAELFSELTYSAEGEMNPSVNIADLSLLLHEMWKKNPKKARRLKRFLKQLSADEDPVVRAGAAKVARWIDVGPVVFVSPEVSPISKAGGMANVVGEMPKMLAEAGLKVYVITPLYKYGEVKKEDHIERGYIREMTIEENGIRFPGKPVQVYMGRQGMVSAGIGQTKIDKVQFFLLANDTYADELYGPLSGDTTDPDNRATAEHWALRAQFLSLGALEALKAMNVSPSIVVGNDWMTAPLMAHLNSGGSLYRNDPFFAGTKTVGWVHNNGQDYQFRAARYQPDGYGGTVDLLSNLGLPDADRSWFLDPHQDDLVNFMRAYLEHSGYAVAVSKGQVEDYLASNEKGGAEGFLRIFRRMYRQRRLFGLVNGLMQKKLQRHWFGKSIFDVKTEAEKAELLRVALERKKAAKRRMIGNESSFVVNMISRIAEQKGIAYVIPFVEHVVHNPRYNDVVFVFGGPGEPHLTEQLSLLASRYPERVKYYNKFIMGELRDDIFLSGDLFIVFSTFEPRDRADGGEGVRERSPAFQQAGT